MAQSRSFFGLRKGSTKSLTFQVLNGKQITKERVYQVKNPQTIAQMQQRALMATASRAYSALKVICDHSFEGVEIGAKSMAEFIKLNLAYLSKDAPQINLTEYKVGNYVDNFYQISKGSLPQPETDYTKATGFVVNTGLKKKESNPKWSEIADSMGIKKDGMLTFVLTSGSECYWLRIKFNNAMWDKEAVIGQSNISQLAAMSAIEGNSFVFEDYLTLDNSTDNFKFKLQTMEDEMAAVIVSEKAEGVWKRSNARLEGELTFMYDAAFSTYPINTTLLLNGGKMTTNIIKK